MQQWEKRYLHEKAARDSQCEALGVPIPKDEKYGVLKHVQELWRRFNGKEFWSRFESRGHDCAIFEQCKCSRD